MHAGGGFWCWTGELMGVDMDWTSLGASRHTDDPLNGWARAVAASGEVAEIALLNIMGSRYYRVQKSAMDKDHRRWATDDLAVPVRGPLDFPGAREFWSGVQPSCRPEISRLIADSLKAAGP